MAENIPHPKPHTRWQRFRKCCYNKSTKEICGRTWQSWVLLWTYYVFSYCLFGALFAILLGIDYYKRDKVVPQHNFHHFQPFMQEPGMAVIPKGDQSSYATVINVLDRETNVAQITEFLKSYPAAVSVSNCGTGTDPPGVCVMKTDNGTLGPCSPDSDPTFGYSTLEPCVIVKINQIWAWKPHLYEQRPAGLPQGVEFSPTSIPITCEVWNKLYETKYEGVVTEVKIYPPSGISGHCFPYCGSDRPYVQPFVMAKFKGMTSPTQPVAIVCVAHAQNIIDSRPQMWKLADRIGSINFILSA